ncbi:hypothetical protein GCM10028833_32840 [Glycomyces tarimensis]
MIAAVKGPDQTVSKSAAALLDALPLVVAEEGGIRTPDSFHPEPA